MSVLDDASNAGGGLTLPNGTKNVELKGEGGQWSLVFDTTSGEEVRVRVPNLMRGMKLLERAQASLQRSK